MGEGGAGGQGGAQQQNVIRLSQQEMESVERVIF